MDDRSTPAQPVPERGKAGFIALMAALMASNTLAIDAMLPALSAIGGSFGVEGGNRTQLVVTAYLLGFGLAQLGFGPLSDRFGRKRLLLGGLAFYTLTAVVAAVAPSFELLLAARALQGAAAASTRVLVIAVVRDRYQGREMARIMSLVTIVFMMVPLLAPAFGQVALGLWGWRHVFTALALYGAALAACTALRLPETLSKDRRRPLSFRTVAEAFRSTARSRASAGNTVAQTLMMGALFAFVTSIQQIVFEAFKRPQLLAIIFPLIAAPMAFSAYANSRLVARHGPRKILILALAAFSCANLFHLAVAWFAGETIWMFVLLQAAATAVLGFIGSNATALAMEPLGHVAGSASSLQGTVTTAGGALIGLAIGQQFDGTTIPFLLGITICGFLALAAAFWANEPPARRGGGPRSHARPLS